MLKKAASAFVPDSIKMVINHKSATVKKQPRRLPPPIAICILSQSNCNHQTWLVLLQALIGPRDQELVRAGRWLATCAAFQNGALLRQSCGPAARLFARRLNRTRQAAKQRRALAGLAWARHPVWVVTAAARCEAGWSAGGAAQAVTWRRPPAVSQCWGGRLNLSHAMVRPQAQAPSEGWGSSLKKWEQGKIDDSAGEQLPGRQNEGLEVGWTDKCYVRRKAGEAVRGSGRLRLLAACCLLVGALAWVGTATSAKINKLYHRPGQPSQIIMSEFARLNVANKFKKSATGIIWSRKKDSEQREGRRSFEEFSKLHCWAADRAGWSYWWLYIHPRPPPLLISVTCCYQMLFPHGCIHQSELDCFWILILTEGHQHDRSPHVK